ncbi:hypothetical protein N7466_011144 [Penicillium verhagenii]|uniref:uncharacterized protein n=1 Tax=Penicillium verhagenii TaxID=1562060 RepID=UPI002544E275|nr:uncharacterized protein N7466_011144 [Penicillium verhagenii]KAJ5917590.1 hypothetical protein N7466_011144 [Penicillium verhagenii]
MAKPELPNDQSEIQGSASHPMPVGDDDNSGKKYTPEQDDSDGDTVRLSTPEFWEIVGDGGASISQNNTAVTESSPSWTPYGQSSDFGTVEPSVATCTHLREEISEPPKASKGDKGLASGLQNTENCSSLVPEKNLPSCGQRNALWLCGNGSLELSTDVIPPLNDNPLNLLSQNCPGKREREDQQEVECGTRRSKRVMRQR